MGFDSDVTAVSLSRTTCDHRITLYKPIEDLDAEPKIALHSISCRSATSTFEASREADTHNTACPGNPSTANLESSDENTMT